MSKPFGFLKVTKLAIRFWITVSLSLIFAAAIIVGDVMCTVWSAQLTDFLAPDTVINNSTMTEETEKALAAGDELVQRMGEESTVLMKNNGVLPLGATATNKVNVNLFMDNFYMGSSGSSGAIVLNDDKKVDLPAALERENFRVNRCALNSVNDSGKMDAAKQHSDVAIIVIARVTQENAGANELTDENNGKMPVQISNGEIATIDYAKANFDKVIVLINSGNTMELGELQDEGVDAVLDVSWPGQSGALGVARILAGTVNPSGKLVDTFAYDVKKSPVWANKIKSGGQITYAENIYIGYRWYETADVEGYFDSVSNSYGTGYNGEVQFPFGHGLSYTTFGRKLESVKWITADGTTEPAEGATFTTPYTTVEISVTVTNTGDVAGKDIVQLYYTPPYKRGGIEKSAINLLAFQKTDLLYPESEADETHPNSQTVKLKFKIYDMASYDCYDKNNNGIRGYELEPGKYELKIMENAHTPDSTIDKNKIEFNVANIDGVGFAYRFDPDTKRYVTNRFTGDSSLYAPIDGSTGGDAITYLSRNNFTATFPTTRTPNRTGSAVSANGRYSGYDDDTSLEMPVYGQGDKGLYLWTLEDGTKATQADLEKTTGKKLKANEELLMKLGADYNAPEWKELLSQLTFNDLNELPACGGFGTIALDTVGKPFMNDRDGPAGFNLSANGGGFDKTKWTGFACENLIAMSWDPELCYAQGAAMAIEGRASGVDGNYGVCVNLHRNTVNTRNFEGFSEDPLISGKFAARMLNGAATRGLYVYLKHLALSEPGQNPNNLNTWLTEQTLREVYLKAFEIAVKEGEANAVMSAFNRVGGVNSCENYTLLTTVLRGEWKFRGSVVTDYGMGSPISLIRSGGDIRLDPTKGRGKTVGLNRDNIADMHCAYVAVKNVLWTNARTYYRMMKFDPTTVTITADITYIHNFQWWILAVVLLNVVVFGLIAWQAVMLTLSILKTNKQLAVADGASASGSNAAGEDESRFEPEEPSTAPDEPSDEKKEK